jgi:hypothetical protein
MNFKYKILELQPETHSIVVRFFSDEVSEADLSTNEMELREVPHRIDKERLEQKWFPKLRPDGTPWRCSTDLCITLPIPAPTGKELDLYIAQFCQTDYLEKKKAIKDPKVDTSLSELKDLVLKTNNMPLIAIDQSKVDPFEDLKSIMRDIGDAK